MIKAIQKELKMPDSQQWEHMRANHTMSLGSDILGIARIIGQLHSVSSDDGIKFMPNKSTVLLLEPNDSLIIYEDQTLWVRKADGSLAKPEASSDVLAPV
jgi:hypothetical protein